MTDIKSCPKDKIYLSTENKDTKLKVFMSPVSPVFHTVETVSSELPKVVQYVS